MSVNFQGQTVAITGAAGGLGKAIAKAFLDAGANVAICDINQDRLSATKSEWEAHNSQLIFSQTDITDEGAVESFMKNVTDKYGKVDILINNAGMMDSFDPVATTTKASWDRVLGLNLTGTFLATKAAVNAMLRNGGGVVLYIGSNASVRGSTAGAVYTASKHGLLGLCRNTAAFHGPQGVYSIMIMLGGMEDTNMVESFKISGLNQEAMGQMRAMNPGYVQGKTKLELEDVAKFCLFYADRKIAEIANGGCVSVNKNWPAA